MKRKSLCFIGQYDTICDHISRQLDKFFGAYLDIKIWCVESSQPPFDYAASEVFIASSHAALNRVRHMLPDGRIIMVAARAMNIENLDRLLEIKPGTRAIVVGSSEETSTLAVQMIRSLGFDNLDMIPYYPNYPDAMPQNINIAITMGLPQLVPPLIPEVIDLGAKGIDLSTFQELINCLNLPSQILNEISHYYTGAIINLGMRLRKVADLNETLKREREVILNTINEAIVAVNETNEIVVFNPAAEKVFHMDKTDALGGNANRVIPHVNFLSFLKAGKTSTPEIVKINKGYFIVTARSVSDDEKSAKGAVATFRPVEELQELETKVRRELRTKGHIARYTFNDVIGSSTKLRETVSLAKKFAGTDLSVLLEGESGTGKEVLAQAIHNFSPRKGGPFVALNFAALPENLVESELFGYEQGAFSGARKGGKQGLFEAAHKGTIFLDEIGDASLEVQKKLLRVLEEKEVRRVGGNTLTPVDVRVIAATNVDLKVLVEQNRFRSDLFYRLYSLPIVTPPLRATGDDILLLFRWFAEKFYQWEPSLEDSLEKFLLRYHWPGNVRELQNVVRYMFTVMVRGERSGMGHLPPYLLNADVKGGVCSDADGIISGNGYGMVLKELESRDCVKSVAMILMEIKKVTLLNKGIGRQALLKRLGPANGRLSEHGIRHYLKILASLGYINSGFTRQGCRITKTGEEFLSSIVSSV